MPTRRMEAFSDAVIAILITVMVLELRIPHGRSWLALRDSVPVLLTYLLSFIMIVHMAHEVTNLVRVARAANT